MIQKMIDVFFAALCCWREARGEDDATKVGMLHVLRNRVERKWGGRRTFQDVATAPWQFSGLTAPGDPNLHKFPRHSDPTWKVCLYLAGKVVLPDPGEVVIDPTEGAVFYHDVSLDNPPKAWGPVLKTKQIGRLIFYIEDKEVA